MRLSEKARIEVFEAECKVNKCYEELDRDEEELSAILKKYGWKDTKETDISDSLPTMALFSGLKLYVLEDKGHTAETKTVRKIYLRDREGNDLRVWERSPSLVELIEACNCLMTA